jgi:predicted DNA-binding protein (MmcQ/YjbR family)
MTMKLEQIRDVCMSFPGATEQIQWGEDVVFKVAGKMFVVVGPAPGNCFSFKCEEEAFHELTELPGIIPAPYLARAKWVQLRPAECRLRASEIVALLRQSYELVVAKLPKRTQKALREKAPRKATVHSRGARAHAKR